jgi:hypothetical protein
MNDVLCVLANDVLHNNRYWAGVDLDAPALFKFKPRRAKMTAPPGIVEVDPDMKMVSSAAYAHTSVY